MRHGLGALTIVVAFVYFETPVSAHHSLEDTHDLRRVVTLTGVVSSVEWANPHARVVLDVTSANGDLTRWSVELGAPNTMTRLGVGSAVLKPGSQVTVDVWLTKDSTLTASALALRLADGSTFRMPSLWARRLSS
jgi:hypothetical protein